MVFSASLSYRSLWTPDRIPTALWLDAADSSTVILNGSTVSQWNDKSGNGRNLSQGTSSLQPTYVSGSNYIEFVQASNHHLFMTSAPFYAAGKCSVFGVVERTAFAQDTRWMAEGASSSDTPLYCFSQAGSETGGSNNARTYYRGNATQTVLTNVDLFTNAWVAGKHINTFIDTGSSIACGRDGQIGSYFSYSRPSLTMNRFALGGILRSSFILPMGINIYEVVILTTSLTDALRQRIEGYLSHKWGLTANLPSDHPYKNNPPRGL